MYTVTNNIEPIIWGADGTEAILQCVKMIITTPVGSVPLDRGFGIDISLLDTKSEDGFSKFADYVKDLVHKFEPRVIVKNVEVTQDKKQEQPFIQVFIDLK